MRYLKQPRGPGTGWAFRMATPVALIGKVNPQTGRPFGREISVGLQTRRLVEARLRRDVLLGELRKLALGIETDGRFSMERAEAWAKAIAEQDESGTTPHALDLRSIVAEEIENAEQLPARERPRKEVLRRFGSRR